MEGKGDQTNLLPNTRVRWRGQPEAEQETCLVVIYGANLGAKIRLDHDHVSIGRDPRCDIVIPLDDISRQHCEIERRGGAWTIRDLGSTNGTRLNDSLLLPEHGVAMTSGDYLRLGGVVFKFFDGRNVELLYHESIHRMAVEDGLTELHNRRYLVDFLEREMARCRRNAGQLALALFDIDHFKAINDEHGHVAGDDILRELAVLFRGVIRRESCLARYGGEEFAAVLPDASLEAATCFAERMRAAVEAYHFVVHGDLLDMTVSVGVAVFRSDMKQASAFIGAADIKLYEAKQAGRNCVAT